MKMIRKVVMSAGALVFIGSSVFAQSLADAQKAIDAEQYQKAKTMLKNLTTTQPTNADNYFYLGWVYLTQDYADSAKTQFEKGISINPKSALNYAGLGAVARVNKDQAGATTNFNQAITLAPKKDITPYLYVGKAYLLPVGGSTTTTPADAAAAIDVLQKGKTANPKVKDAGVDVTIGFANLSQLKASDADNNFNDALADDPKYLPAYVAKGSLLRMAHNWDGAAEQFKAALAIDPNFGPAYREWAETDYRESVDNRSVASAKIKEAVDYYKKYLDLTDRSLESQLRYADFLLNAGDYATLQQVASDLAKYKNSNLRVYRYIGIAAFQNKDYTTGIDALNKFISEAGPGRLYYTDYLYLGRLQIASGKDTTAGIANLKKAVSMDSTKAEDIYTTDIIPVYKVQKDYLNEGKSYEELINLSPGKAMVSEHYSEANYYYYAFFKNTADSSVLVKADSALAFVERTMKDKPYAPEYLLRARIADLKDADFNNMKGLPKPYYEKYIELVSANPTDKNALAEAYAYLGAYAEFHDKDDAKALEYFTKAKELNPANEQVIYYFNQKAAPQKATPKK
jgi:tetratricopeptide (TPR) repeat protein